MNRINISADICHHGEQQQDDDNCRADIASCLPCLLPQVAGGSQRNEDESVQNAYHDYGHTASEGISVQQVKHTPDHFFVPVNRHTANDIGEYDSEQERRQQTTNENRGIPRFPPSAIIHLAPELERDTARDKRQQQHDERDIETAEHRRIPFRKGSEHSPPGRN